MLPFSPDATISPASVLKRAALIFLPVAAALTLVILLGIRIDSGIRRDITQMREKARVELASEQIAQDFDEVGADLHLIASLPSLRSYLDTRSPRWHKELTDLLLQLSTQKQRYDQIRYLDKRGKEVIRINFNHGKPTLVKNTELQDKSGRYYFHEAIGLERDEIYVSPFDLNMEQHKLEVPYKPMIRFATPVFDSAGRKKGALIFNYLGRDLLKEFREIMRGSGHNAMLLNSDGYWLINSNPENEWGFILGRKDRTFAHDFPDEWRDISSHESGSLMTRNGLFVYGTIYPLLSRHRNLSPGRKAAARTYRWKVVSYVPRNVLAAHGFFRRTSIEVLIGTMYLLLALAALMIALVTLSRRQARSALAESNARYDELARTIPVGVYQFRFETNGSYRFDYVSPVFCQILGLHAALVMGDPGSAFNAVHPDDAESLVKSNREAGNTLQPFRWEGRFIVRGETRWIRIASDPTQQGAWGSLWSGVVTDITERKILEHELEQQAHIDMLTGLSNRRHFFELAEKEMSRARRHHEPFAVLMLDVDHFKQFNDTYGHDVGDMVLRKMGAICTGVLRGNDIMGRLGGEEFAILLPETPFEQALETAERLRHAVAESGLGIMGGAELHFTVSVGVACLTPQDENIDSILKRADAALYTAKNAGRNRVRASERETPAL